MTLAKKLWIGIGVLIVLSPIGLILPDHFKAGAAWGEWTAREIRVLTGYVPEGMDKLSSLWNAPMPGYAGNGLGYIIAAIFGITIIAGIVFLAGIFLKRRDR